MDQKVVALQFRKLASDPDNQEYIVKEAGCMKGLMGFLESKNEQVLLISLQALQFLSSHPNNKKPLVNYPKLLPKVVHLADSEHAKVKMVAERVLENLEDYINGDGDSSVASAEPAVAAQVKKRVAKKKKNSGAGKGKKKKGAGKSAGYLYGIPLTVEGMELQYEVDSVEKALLTVAGVVSVTVEASEQQVTIYTRVVESEILPRLIAAVKAVGFEASAGQGQKDRRPSYQSASAADENAAAGNGNVSYPSGKPAYLNTAAMKTYRHGAVAHYGGVTQNSLEARLRKQREKQVKKQKEQTKAKSLFGAVTSYFW